jgi:hypothetical protein
MGAISFKAELPKIWRRDKAVDYGQFRKHRVNFATFGLIRGADWIGWINGLLRFGGGRAASLPID